jgi:hypothetical protein
VSLLLSLLALSATAAPCETSFVFVGQPECVELTYVDGRTQLANRCEEVLLVDQSVQGIFQPVFPGKTVQIRDLSAFTLGLAGKLYRTTALVEQTCDEG